MRLFAAVVPPEPVLHHLAAALSPFTASGGHGRRWIPAQNWHITVGFFGDISESVTEAVAADLDEMARNHEPFQLRLTGAGVFRNNVLWIGTGGDTSAMASLMAATTAVRDAWTDTRDDRARQRAHVTVARTRGGGDPAEIAHALAIYQGPSWTVDAVRLESSQLGLGEDGHPKYTVLTEHRFGCSDAASTSQK